MFVSKRCFKVMSFARAANQNPGSCSWTVKRPLTPTDAVVNFPLVGMGPICE